VTRGVRIGALVSCGVLAWIAAASSNRARDDATAPAPTVVGSRGGSTAPAVDRELVPRPAPSDVILPAVPAATSARSPDEARGSTSQPIALEPGAPMPVRGVEIEYEHAGSLLQATSDTAELEAEAAMLDAQGRHEQAAAIRRERDLARAERDRLRASSAGGRYPDGGRVL